MKKTLSIILIIALSLSLSALFAGCEEDKQAGVSSTETVSGEGDISPIPEFETPEFEKPSAPTIKNPIVGTWVGDYDLSELMGTEAKIKMTFEFNENNTYRISVEEKDMKDFCEKILQATAEMAGVTVDEILAQAEMSLDDYVVETMESMKDELSKTGKYKLDGDKLYINIDGSDNFEEAPATIEISDSSIILKDEEFEITLSKI